MNLPPNAKLVFKGEIFDVYQWEQEMFDGSTATFERIRRPDSVQIIPVVDGKAIIVDEEQPFRGKFVGLVGGIVDEGEEPEEAARRELLEETGMEARTLECFHVFDNPGKVSWKSHYFFARDCRSVAEPKLDPGEKIALRSVSADEFVRIADTDAFRSKALTVYLLRRRAEGTLDEFKKLISASHPYS